MERGREGSHKAYMEKGGSLARNTRRTWRKADPWPGIQGVHGERRIPGQEYKAYMEKGGSLARNTRRTWRKADPWPTHMAYKDKGGSLA